MNLTEARKRAGYTREKAAVAIGVAVSTLRAWEKGVNAIPSTAIPALQDILRLSDTEILDIIKQLKQESA